jgi:hypothetical protein
MPKYDEEQIRHLELAVKAAEKGQAFNSVFIAAGYATFFALWKNLNGCAVPTSHFAAGALLTFSATLYVAWMVLGLVVLNLTMMGLIKQASSSPRVRAEHAAPDFMAAADLLRMMISDPESGFTRSQRIGFQLLLGALSLAKLWPYAITLIMIPALSAVVIIFSTYVHAAWLSYHGITLICTTAVRT